MADVTIKEAKEKQEIKPLQFLNKISGRNTIKILMVTNVLLGVVAIVGLIY